MYSKTIKSINEPSDKIGAATSFGTNKAATSCTVKSCSAPQSQCTVM